MTTQQGPVSPLDPDLHLSQSSATPELILTADFIKTSNCFPAACGLWCLNPVQLLLPPRNGNNLPCISGSHLLNSASCDRGSMDFKRAGSCKGTSSSGYSLIVRADGRKSQNGNGRQITVGWFCCHPGNNNNKKSYLKLLIPD